MKKKSITHKPTALILSAAAGHQSLAEAFQEILARDWHTKTYQPPASKELNSYRPFYLFFPQLFKIPFKLSQTDKLRSLIKSYAQLKFQSSVYSLIEKYQPSLICTTWFLYLPITDQLKKVTSIPTINLVHDPLSFHPLELSQNADANLIFDQKSRKHALKLNAPPNSLYPIGWLTRDRFKPPRSKEKVRKKLKLKPNLFTILVCSGSGGTNWVATIAPAFLQSSQPVQIVFNTAKNKMLTKAVKSLKEILNHYPNNKTVIIPLPFTNDLHLYMQAADLVIGKAGPNTIFESVATHTPFFAVTHIAGQEDGNLKIIKNYKLGYVEENPLQAVKLLRRLIKKPHQLHRLEPNLKKLATYNKQGKNKLKKLIKQLQPKHSILPS